MRSLTSNWLKLFLNDYRLPLWSTFGLVLVLVLLLLVRTYERGVLVGVLGDSNTKNGNYANLINGDKEADLTKNEVGVEDAETTATTRSSISVATSSPNTSLTLDSDGGTTTLQPGMTSPPSGSGSTVEKPGPAPPDGPFSAQISSFKLRDQSQPFLCDSSAEGLESMCKQYEFAAGIGTFNGPGTVKFSFKWQGQASGESVGSFEATNGDTVTQVSRQINLSCEKPGNYSFQVILMDPSNAESPIININHDCGNIRFPSGR